MFPKASVRELRNRTSVRARISRRSQRHHHGPEGGWRDTYDGPTSNSSTRPLKLPFPIAPPRHVDHFPWPSPSPLIDVDGAIYREREIRMTLANMQGSQSIYAFAVGSQLRD